MALATHVSTPSHIDVIADDKTTNLSCRSCVNSGRRGRWAKFPDSRGRDLRAWLTRHEKHGNR